MFSFTSSMSSGNESSGGIVLSSEGGLPESSSAAEYLEGGGCATEGEGRGKDTAPANEDSSALNLPEIDDFMWLLGTLNCGTGSAVDLC